MPSLPRVSRRTMVLVGVPVVVAAATAGIVLGVVGGGGHSSAAPSPSASSSTSASASPSTTTKPPPTKKKPKPVSPLTGRPGGLGKPVLAVKIDNTVSARPQVNVNSADIVYVEQVEGGITRLMAIFNSNVPKVVGPVRSGRESDVELLKEYGHVGLAYSGAQHKVLPIIDAGSLVDLSPDHDAAPYFRSSSRPAPYNLFLQPRRMIARHPQLAKVRDVGFRFGKPYGKGRPGSRVTLSMSASTTFTFTYDRRTHKYDEAIGGTSIYGAGGHHQNADNVLIQVCDVHRSRFHDFLGNYTPFTATVGRGRFWLLRGGRSFKGVWSRPKADGPTSFTDGHGHPIRLAPGRTWVLLKDQGLPVGIS